MAGEDHVVAVDEQRVGESEVLYTVGNLPDIFPAVGARIARASKPRRKGILFAGRTSGVSHD